MVEPSFATKKAPPLLAFKLVQQHWRNSNPKIFFMEQRMEEAEQSVHPSQDQLAQDRPPQISSDGRSSSNEAAYEQNMSPRSSRGLSLQDHPSHVSSNALNNSNEAVYELNVLGEQENRQSEQSSAYQIAEAQSNEQPHSQTAVSKPRKPPSHPDLIQMLVDINYLIFFSYAGYTTRYGLEIAFASPSGIGYTCLYFVLFTDFYANALGCFVMGLISEINIMILIPNKRIRTSNFVTVGFMTGYCGCTTTFSSWQYDSMYALVNGQVGTFFLREILGFCVSYYALVFGHDMTNLIIIPIYNLFLTIQEKLKKKKPANGQAKSREEVRKGTRFATIAWRIIGILFLFINVVLTGLFIALLSSPTGKTARLVSAALLMSPFGCILRYFFSLLNTKLAPRIPIFTFCANLLATLIVGFFKVTDHRYPSVHNVEGLDIFFMSVVGGFCGCLSTVSSLVEEIRTKLTSVEWRYLYIFITFVIPCLVLLVIEGPFLWTE